MATQTIEVDEGKRSDAVPRENIVQAVLTWGPDRADEGQALARAILDAGEVDPAIRALAHAWCGNAAAAARDGVEYWETKPKAGQGGYGPIVHAASKAGHGTITNLVREGLKLATPQRLDAVVALAATAMDMLDISGARDELLALVALAGPEASTIEISANRSGGMRRALCETVTDCGVESVRAAEELERVATTWSHDELERGRPDEATAAPRTGLAQDQVRKAARGLEGGSASVVATRQQLTTQAQLIRATAIDHMREELVERTGGHLVGAPADIRAAFGEMPLETAAARLEEAAEECDRLHDDPLSEALGEIRLETREILPTPSLRMGGGGSPREWAAHALAVATAPTGRIAAGALAVALREGAATLKETAAKQAGRRGQDRTRQGPER